MNLMSRLLNGLIVLTVLLLSLTSLSAEWLFELGTMTDQFGNRVSLLELQSKGDKISHEIQKSIEHLHTKDTVAEALIKGQLSLVDAAALFRSLYDDPKAWHHPHRPRPARDAGLVWCREVIDWTDTKVRIEQSRLQADALRQRLEAELQRQLDYHGTVKLPE